MPLSQWFPAFVALFIVLIALVGCGVPEGEVTIELPDPIERDLAAIQERDTLVVLTQFNSTSYFIYRGEPMGYEYEFLSWFAQENDLHLKTVVVPNRDSLFVLLNQGIGDVVAARMTATPTDSARVAFTEPLYRTRPVVVQREDSLEDAAIPAAVDSLVDSAAAASPDTGAVIKQFRARLITHPQQLTGEAVHVLNDTRFEDRLVELSDEATGDIYVVEVDSGTAEMLMRDVAEENIDYTVGHENVAELQESYYSNLAVLPSLVQPYEVSWAVRQNAPALWQALNDWITNNPNLASQLYNKYFVDREGYRERVDDDYLSSETGRLSPYDSLFQHHAPTLDWDWRLLASQAFQESRFDPRARSWAGAMGLLQLMPGTARQYGVSDAYNPEANVGGAVRFLTWLQEFWVDEIPDEAERLKFILASYNAGPGHVADARRLTEKHEGDPTQWTDVAYWLLRKSERSIYTDPVVRYGFCRGLEPVTYVARILDRYDHYLQFVDPSKPPADSTLAPAAP